MSQLHQIIDDHTRATFDMSEAEKTETLINIQHGEDTYVWGDKNLSPESISQLIRTIDDFFVTCEPKYSELYAAVSEDQDQDQEDGDVEDLDDGQLLQVAPIPEESADPAPKPASTPASKPAPTPASKPKDVDVSGIDTKAAREWWHSLTDETCWKLNLDVPDRNRTFGRIPNKVKEAYARSLKTQ